MAHMVIVLKVVLQAALSFERAETQVTRDVVVFGIVDVILESVPVFEYPFAQVTVVLVQGRVLDVRLEDRFVREPDVAYTAPVLA